MAQNCVDVHHELVRPSDGGAIPTAKNPCAPVRTGATPISTDTLQFHRYANVFSLLDAKELDTLADSAKRSGIREPIVLHEGKILDGRNRYRAALKVGIPFASIPKRDFDVEKEGDPAEFVWDANVNRRHLNETQRGLAAAEMETFRHGGKRRVQEPRAALEEKPVTRAELASRYGVGHNTLHSMSVVRDQAVPELAELARNGALSVRTAKCIAEMPAAKQRALIARAESAPKRERRVALQMEARKEIQRGKLAEIAKSNRTLDPRGETYDVIYADPPWQFDTEVTGNAWAVENHYPTMPIDEICKLPVAKLAGERAILFLWTTDHHLIDAEQVLAAWGFKRRARMVWVKNRIGLGRFVRNKHEYLIIATRGDFPAPPTDCVPDSVISYPKGEHSAKPPLYEMIERMTPGLNRKIELFARNSAPGWDAWGNQAETPPAESMRPPVESEIIVPAGFMLQCGADNSTKHPLVKSPSESAAIVSPA